MTNSWIRSKPANTDRREAKTSSPCRDTKTNGWCRETMNSSRRETTKSSRRETMKSQSRDSKRFQRLATVLRSAAQQPRGEEWACGSWSTPNWADPAIRSATVSLAAAYVQLRSLTCTGAKSACTGAKPTLSVVTLITLAIGPLCAFASYRTIANVELRGSPWARAVQLRT